MDGTKPSIKRIFWTDYLTSLAAIAILIVVGFFLFDRLVQPIAFTREFPFVAGAVCILGITIIVWRIRLISSAFEFGWKVEGDVVAVSFFRNRGSITYIYTVQGERYQASNVVMKQRHTKSLERGQKVVIMASRDNPKIAFLRDLYL